MGTPDHFAVFGLTRNLSIDLDLLESEFLRLSREHHPDRFAGAPAEQLGEIQRASARVNDAHRVLKDPVRRAEHLLDICGIVRPDGEAKCPPDLLMEVFELREAIEESPGPEIGERVRALWAEAGRSLVQSFEDHDAAAPDARGEALKTVRELLDRRRFLANLIREVDPTPGSR